MDIIARTSRLALGAAITAWVFVVGCAALSFVLQHRLATIDERRFGGTFATTDLVFVIAIASALFVGSALVIRHPQHPVGWLFLLLAASIPAAGVFDEYAAYGAIARPGSLPGADLAAVVGDKMFFPWLVLLALILLLTPGGRLTGRIWRIGAWAAVVGGAVGFGAGMLRPYEGVYALQGVIDNPLELSGWVGPLRAVGLAGVIVLHLGVLAGAASVVVRFRAARATERQRLRWLGMAAIPFVLLVLGAFVAALANNELLLAISAGGFLAIVPVATGLAIEQYHLYDIDRLVSRSVTWILLSAALIGTYAVVVIFVGQSIGGLGGSEVPAVVGTLAAASVAAPLRRAIQDELDRRFNRRRFDAVAMMRAFAREPDPGLTVEQALRAATGDERLSVAYWVDERELWASEAGGALEPGADGVSVERRGQVVCVIGFEPGRVERQTVEAAAAEALTELENARLRAAITLQLVEVRDSRARIVAAQLAERQRIERNLHDGAQQRLLALAMQLRAAELSNDPGRAQAVVVAAVDELQEAVRELRDLANGLRPVALADGGLAAAFDELAARTPVAVSVEATAERFAPATEEAAWFIACEAVANAVKHAAPETIAIRAARHNGQLQLVIEDDGAGGADPAGHGLRGIADRADAAGGRLRVQPGAGRGTIVIAELPCAS